MTESARTSDALLELARAGDPVALRELLELHRAELRRMVAARLDRRLTSRVDASDVVQETLTDAARRLDEFVRDRPLPFLGWLRQLAAERVIHEHRRHLFAQRRSVCREGVALGISEGSAIEMVRGLAARDTSPSNRMHRQERRERVLAALAELSPRDREVLVMRHFEYLGPTEIAERLGITPRAVEGRLLRALMRIRARLEADS